MDVHLTQAQLAELRSLLEKAEAEAAQGLSDSTTNAKPVDLDLSIGRLSRVDALQQQHMAIARRDRATLQLQQIRSALGRIEAGNYGACIRCDEPIALARLRARPEALVCRDCQSAGGG
ncbi:MAG: TraR/DksA family transcriptional regulator [Myxococcota bacterium]